MTRGLRAIDCHVHPMDEVSLGLLDPARREAMQRYFRRNLEPRPMDELADEYRELRMMAVLLVSDDSTTSGIPPVPNDHIAGAVRQFPDVFLGFGGVDPHQGRLAINEARRIREELGLVGLKFNPARQHFDPSDARFEPLWRTAADLGLIVLFHSGMLGNGAGTRGGLGFKLRYANPLLLDDLAAEHPDLTIISAHPAWPWLDEQLAVARHKANVYIDLSGWAPKYFSADLVRNVNTFLGDRTLFGSDSPVVTPQRWLAEFEDQPFKDEVRPKILLENARRLFGLT